MKLEIEKTEKIITTKHMENKQQQIKNYENKTIA